MPQRDVVSIVGAEHPEAGGADFAVGEGHDFFRFQHEVGGVAEVVPEKRKEWK